MIRSRRLHLLTIIILFTLSSSAESGPKIPPDQMPIGIFSTYSYGDVTPAMLDSLHSELGVNFAYISACPWSDCAITGSEQARMYFDHGILPVLRPLKTENQTLNLNFQGYEKSHYMKVDAGDRNSSVRFYAAKGESQNGWFIPSRQSNKPYVALDNLWYDTERHTWMDSNSILYYPSIRIWADVDSHDLGDTLAILNIFAGEKKDSLFYSEAVVVDSAAVHDTTIWNFNGIPYIYPDSIKSGKCSRITFQIVAYPTHEFMIDWLKVYDDYGRRCVESGEYDHAISQYVSQPWCDSMVMNWFLADEPDFDQLLPYAHIDSVVRFATGSAFTGDTIQPITSLVGTWYKSRLRVGAFLDINTTPVIWCNYYPYFGNTSHTGSSHSNAFQHVLTKVVARADSDMRSLAAEHNASWWRSIQTWYRKEGDVLKMRWPTASELSCQIFMALCYDAKGIAYYPYLGGENDKSLIQHAIRYGADSSFAISPLWHAIHDNITPYLKAIDKAYLPLTWNDAFTVDPGKPFPSGKWISSINTWSDPDSTNPDAGWYQVGQYTNGDDKYIMLVNRACSANEQGGLAPSATATIELKQSAIGHGSSVYIIDIATGTNADDWTGVPDSTFVNSHHGVFSYTTVLRPGEGRLYKVIIADQ